LSKKEFVGLALDGDVIRVARVLTEGKKLKLKQLDSITLVDKPDNFSTYDNGKNDEGDPIFGFNGVTNHNGTGKKSNDLGQTDILTLTDDPDDTDIKSNDTLLYGLLRNIDHKSIKLALNIPVGTTSFHILKDRDYQKLSKKELQDKLNEKLSTLYGKKSSIKQHAYELRNDGGLILSTSDMDSVMLDMIDQSRLYYSGNIFVKDILPDEATIINLVRANHTLKKGEISCIVLFSSQSVRLIFLQGDELWSVTPVINKKVNNPKILDTIFSKILWQIDTGEIPNLDKIIIANNLFGNHSIRYFRDNFPGIDVDNFRFYNEFLEMDSSLAKSFGPFTIAIGLAIAASEARKKHFQTYSFLPKYVEDRQKVFKLHWHGLLLLALLALTPVMLNNNYQSKKQQIRKLREQINRTEARINELNSVVNQSEVYKNEFTVINKRLTELQDLSSGSKKWSSSLHLMNNGIQNINSCWISVLRNVKGGTVIQGYSLYRDRIPKLTNIFADAELQKVEVVKIRNKTIYKFTIFIKRADKNTPESPLADNVSEKNGK